MPDWMVAPICMVFGFMLLVSGKEVGIDHPIITALIAIGCFLFPLLMLFEPILNRKDTVKINVTEDNRRRKQSEKTKLHNAETKEKKPNLMTQKRKSTLEDIAKRLFPNPRYFKYTGEKMEFTTDIGKWHYTSCNSRSIESIDNEMVEDATRGYARKNNPQPKKKSYSGRCSQDAGGLIFSSECGTPTNNRCPRCNRYACGSCLGSRTYKGRKVCDGCNRSMSGD